MCFKGTCQNPSSNHWTSLPMYQPGCGPCCVPWILMKICGKLTAPQMSNACSVAFCSSFLWQMLTNISVPDNQSLENMSVLQSIHLIWWIVSETMLLRVMCGAHWRSGWSVRGHYKWFTRFTWKGANLESPMTTHMLVSVQGFQVLGQSMFKFLGIHGQ